MELLKKIYLLSIVILTAYGGFKYGKFGLQHQ